MKVWSMLSVDDLVPFKAVPDCLPINTLDDLACEHPDINLKSRSTSEDI